MHLKISSAEVIAANNCLTNLITDELSIEANSVDPEQTSSLIWVNTVCQRGFLDISADEIGRRLLLRLVH